jgi:hypothetical protein
MTKQAPDISCVNNLVQIDRFKNQWALENHKTTQDTPTWDDLRIYIRAGSIPICPEGGTYTVGSLGELPKCSLGVKEPVRHRIP